MSAPADKTSEEWAALCASQAIIIQDLVKEKHERAHSVRKMRYAMDGTSKLMEEESAQHQAQKTAATALIDSLLVIKKEYLVVLKKLRDLAPHAAQSHTNSMLDDADMLEHNFVHACDTA